MGHLILAYDSLAILIGFSALGLAALRRLAIPQARAFLVLLALFTLVMMLQVLQKYAALNLPGIDPWYRFWLRGAGVACHFLVVLATGIYFGQAAALPWRRRSAAILAGLCACELVVLFVPGTVSFLPAQNAIRLSAWFLAALAASLAGFAYAIALSRHALRASPNRRQTRFLLCLILFAVCGFIETAIGFFASLGNPLTSLGSRESGFLYSSLPFVLYCAFLIAHFIREANPPLPALSPDFLLDAKALAACGVTERELQVAAKAAAGHSNEAIAQELFISLATVKTHLHHVFRKTGVTSRYDLMRRFRLD